MESGTVFISYRRSDTKYSVGRLFDHLVLINELPRETIFLDVDIEYGEKFPKVLARTLAETDVLLAVIGKRWLGEAGDNRFNDTDDFVRMEIESALKRQIPIIPVLLEEGTIPSPKVLPQTMRELVEYQACPIRHESFAADTRRLVARLRYILKKGRQMSEALSQRSPEEMEIKLREAGPADLGVSSTVSPQPERPVPGAAATSLTFGAKRQASWPFGSMLAPSAAGTLSVGSTMGTGGPWGAAPRIGPASAAVGNAAAPSSRDPTPKAPRPPPPIRPLPPRPPLRPLRRSTLSAPDSDVEARFTVPQLRPQDLALRDARLPPQAAPSRVTFGGVTPAASGDEELSLEEEMAKLLGRGDPPEDKPPTPPTEDKGKVVIGRYESEGTSYVMFADGAIEARSEAGVFRFASMKELKDFIET